MVHDRPPQNEERFDLYIQLLNASMPLIRNCIPSINPLLVVTKTHLHQAKALAFGLSLIKTPFFLKMEHDHIFVKQVPIYGILHDMMRNNALKVVRFNRRRNKRIKCDHGYYDQPWKKKRSRALWKAHAGESHVYTRTVCFSDMNHVSRVKFYMDTILPPAVKAAPQMVETTIQKIVVYNHSAFGTYIYGGPNFEKTLTHLDASKHGHGELDAAHVAKIQAEPVHRTFSCSPSQW